MEKTFFTSAILYVIQSHDQFLIRRTLGRKPARQGAWYTCKMQDAMTMQTELEVVHIFYFDSCQVYFLSSLKFQTHLDITYFVIKEMLIKDTIYTIHTQFNKCSCNHKILKMNLNRFVENKVSNLCGLVSFYYAYIRSLSLVAPFRYIFLISVALSRNLFAFQH